MKDEGGMKFFIIGLGSMGKRRIRCLKALGYENIFGFDKREDRRKEVEAAYHIKTFADAELAFREVNPDAVIISVPPDVHHLYMEMAIARGCHFFVEASVVDTNMEAIKKKLAGLSLVAAPSATMLFHPSIREIEHILQQGVLGKISNVIYHCGQYLPDWHTYEKVSDYYVSNPLTGGAREIVPFELSWLTQLLGFPSKVCAQVRKTINIEGAEDIDDTYNMLFDYGTFLAAMTIDVVSRYATRRLVLNGDQKQLLWDWNEKVVKIYDPVKGEWDREEYKMNEAASGYNQNIGENMYIEELKCFIDAIEENRPFINTIENDHRVLKLLYACEEADRKSKYVEFR